MPVKKVKITKPTKKQKRAARRAEERRISEMRAMKMHDARRASGDIEIKTRLTQKYYIGCSGWFYWDWRRWFYPRSVKIDKWFDYYTGRFNTVELNAPFYSWPTIGNVKKWLLAVEDKEFVYSIKVNEYITDTKKFKAVTRIVRDFNFIGDILDKHMGCFIYQFPPEYKYTKLRLENLLQQLDHRRRNVIEFRHESWWNEKVYEAFRENNTIFCSCSAPDLPDDLIKTSDSIYIRFHGRRNWIRDDYSKDELKHWAELIRNSGAKHVWAYFNNSFRANSGKNALTLKSLLD